MILNKVSIWLIQEASFGVERTARSGTTTSFFSRPAAYLSAISLRVPTVTDTSYLFTKGTADLLAAYRW